MLSIILSKILLEICGIFCVSGFYTPEVPIRFDAPTIFHSLQELVRLTVNASFTMNVVLMSFKHFKNTI